MSSSSRIPPHKSALPRKPSLSSSFTSCFGASVPISPRHTAAGLASQAGVNYTRLRFHEVFDEDPHYGCRATSQSPDQRNSEEDFCSHGATMRLGGMPHSSSFKERLARKEIFYASEGEQQSGRARRGILKIGKPRAMKEKPRSTASHTFKKSDLCETEAENYEHVRQREKAEREYDDRGRERRGLRLKKGNNNKTEKAIKELEEEEEVDSSPRRASFGARMRQACVQVLETARRGSPHLSELFVGNQLLMQVTASSFNARHAKNMAPSYGFHVFTGNPSFSVMMSSPARSTS